MPAYLTIDLGAGLVEALQLDDVGTCAKIGIDWQYLGSGDRPSRRIRVQGRTSAMKILCVYASAQRHNTNPSYARSATAALKRLEPAIRKADMLYAWEQELGRAALAEGERVRNLSTGTA